MRGLGLGAVILLCAAPLRAGDAPRTANAPAAASATNPPDARYSLALVRDEGAEGCPSGRELAAEVTRRLGRSPFELEAERAIEIHVARSGTAYSSYVRVRERDGSVSGRRELTSEDGCGALFSATALAVALVIDPDAALLGDANASEAVAHFEPPPAAPPTTPRAAPPPRPAPEPTPRPNPPVATPTSDHEVGTATARAAFALGVVPGARPGAELGASAHLSERVSLAVNATYVASGSATEQPTTFDVGLTAFGLAGVFELSRGRVGSIEAEAGASLGALRASVQTSNSPGVVATNPGDFPYLAANAALRLRLQVTRALFVEARGGVLVPLIRRSLQVAATTGNRTIWEQGPLGAVGTAGFGVSFF